MGDYQLVAPLVPMITTAKLRIRATPEADGALLAVLEEGVTVGLDGTIDEGGWVPVTISGWVARRYLQGVSTT